MRTEQSAAVLASEHYEYDAAGRLARVVVRDPHGGGRVSEAYEYGATAGRTRTFYVDSRFHGESVGFGCDGSDAIYSAPGAATVTTLYNARDLPTEMVFHDSGGRVLSRVDFLYDDAGHLVEESQIRFEPWLPPDVLGGLSPAQLDAVGQLLGVGAPERRLHRYDSRGQRIETLYSGVFGRQTVTYNEQGDESGSVSEFEDPGKASIDDQGQITVSAPQKPVSRTEARFAYDYDVHGNWIKKVVQARGSVAQNFSTSSVEERTLTYYD